MPGPFQGKECSVGAIGDDGGMGASIKYAFVRQAAMIIVRVPATNSPHDKVYSLGMGMQGPAPLPVLCTHFPGRLHCRHIFLESVRDPCTTLATFGRMHA